MPETTPFSEPSTLPFAFPPFDAIRHEHYRPAFDAGVAEQRAEVEAIAAQEGEPTFENTIEALERSGATYKRMMRVWTNLCASMSTPEMQALESELAPRIAEHTDSIRLDPRLFARIDAVHAARHDSGLTPEQVRIVERYHRDFVRSGAALPEADRDTLRELNVQITSLTTEFSNRVLAESNDLAVHVADRAELDGLAANEVEAARSAAESAGLDGYLLTLSLPTIQPTIASLTDRDVRRRLHEAATSRGTRGGEHDTRALVGRITALRARAGGAARVHRPRGLHRRRPDRRQHQGGAGDARRDGRARPCATSRPSWPRIEDLLRADGVEGPVQPWDWAYYAARDKAATYDVDTNALRPYFELDRVLTDGIFFAATKLYGITFEQRHDLPVYADGVRVYEVRDEDGSTLGLFVCDWFARPTKQGGAWMDEFVGQSHLLGTLPVVVVCLNVPQPPAGQPALMTLDEVRTGFHEFGHALHGLFSDAVYPRLQGTSVPRDFVEFPSQVNEMWALVARGARQLRRAPRDRRAAGAGRRRPAGRLRRRTARASTPWPCSAPRCWTRSGTGWHRASRPWSRTRSTSSRPRR